MIHVCIPMRDEHPLTRDLVRRLARDGEFERLVIYDNGTSAPTGRLWLSAVERGRFGARVRVERRPRATLYQMWNEAWREALAAFRATGEPVELAILNNDIQVAPGFLGHLARALRAAPDHVWITYPDWRLAPRPDARPRGLTPTRGTWRRGGMSGFAFMIKPEKHDSAGWPFIDERFEWLCGDGDLVQQMERLGGTAARVEGVGIAHLGRATSRNGRNDWTAAAGRRDLDLSRRKYQKPAAGSPR